MTYDDIRVDRHAYSRLSVTVIMRYYLNGIEVKNKTYNRYGKYRLQTV